MCPREVFVQLGNSGAGVGTAFGLPAQLRCTFQFESGSGVLAVARALKAVPSPYHAGQFGLRHRVSVSERFVQCKLFLLMSLVCLFCCIFHYFSEHFDLAVAYWWSRRPICIGHALPPA
jgi:hypothetical protein